MEIEMKVFLRVLVVVLILAGLGLGTYFIFFKPSDNDAVFASLTEMVEYRSTEGTNVENSNRSSDKLSKIESQRNGDGMKNKSDYIEAISQNYDFLIESDANLYLSCQTMDRKLTDVFNYYFAYTQTAQKVQKSVVKNINTSIANYKNAYNDLNLKLNSIINLQNIISDVNNETDYKMELVARYGNAVVSYRKTLNEYASLIQEVKSFVEKYVFDGKIINDRDIATFDISLYTIKNAVSVDFGTNEDGNEKRVEALRLLNDAVIFFDDHLGVGTTSDIKQVKKGCVLLQQGVGYMLYNVKVVTTESGDEIRIIQTGEDKFYRYTKQTDGVWEWYKCDSENYVVSSLDKSNKLEGARLLSEDMFVKNVEGYGDEAKTYVAELKISKMVKNYTYIVENGYLNEFLSVLNSSEKSGFMKDSTIVKGVAEQCVPAIKYILACYGFYS